MPHGNAGNIKHVGHVCKVQLRLERHAHHLEIAHRRVGRVAVQRNVVLLHFLRHVVPRCKRNFAQQVRLAVDYMVQDSDAVVAHADFVLVGEHERHIAEHLAVVFHDTVRFAAHVSSGGFDGGES